MSLLDPLEPNVLPEGLISPHEAAVVHIQSAEEPEVEVLVRRFLRGNANLTISCIGYSNHFEQYLRPTVTL